MSEQPTPRPESFVIPMRRVLRAGQIGAAVALPVAGLLGWFVAGPPGAWGALIGMGIAVGFLAVTVVVALATAGLEPAALGGWVLGSWVVKVLLLIGVLAVLRDATFFSSAWLFGSLLVGTVGALTVESLVVVRTRVPYVEPGP